MTDEKRARGDWQTPQDFALKCCQLIRDNLGFQPDHVVEPTCGIGNFIDASREVFPDADVFGIEIDTNYVSYLYERFSSDSKVHVRQGDFLKDEITGQIAEKGSTLILGNPPWVTNSTLSTLGSDNLPQKSNLKGLRGIDALTGESNFDICEWIILRALSSFKGDDDILAMLCKTSVARNIAIELAKSRANVHIIMYSFDSKKVFDIQAPACLLVCDFRSHKLLIEQTEMDSRAKSTELIFDGKSLTEKLNKEMSTLLGTCQLTWRQGVKHDCGNVMELLLDKGAYVNKLGETVVIEDEFVFPLIKSSKSRQYVIEDAAHAVPMTQRKIGEDTNRLESVAPHFWQYLNNHAELFDARKSSIYRNAPRFAMFGVGDYSYADYKVAVSGFYKNPVFSLAHGKKPIMFDDTCYFLAFDNEADAQVCMLLLNSEIVQAFYQSVAFLDSKRPFSKKVLSKLDLVSALDAVGTEGLNETAKKIGVSFIVSNQDVKHFRSLLQQPTLF